MNKTCPVCSGDFVTKGSAGKYCSRECFGVDQARRSAAAGFGSTG